MPYKNVYITLSFHDRFRHKMLTGVKTWTSRTKQYGFTGNRFKAFNAVFEITGIMVLPLKEVKRKYREEGFISSQDFITFWKKIHPRKGYVPSQNVFVHTFKRILSPKPF